MKRKNTPAILAARVFFVVTWETIAVPILIMTLIEREYPLAAVFSAAFIIAPLPLLIPLTKSRKLKKGDVTRFAAVVTAVETFPQGDPACADRLVHRISAEFMLPSNEMMTVYSRFYDGGAQTSAVRAGDRVTVVLCDNGEFVFEELSDKSDPIKLQ